MRYLVIACAYLSLALLLVPNEVRADIPRPDLWCEGPHDSKHPLAFEALKEEKEFNSMVESGDWQGADGRIVEAFRRFIVEPDPNDTELQEFSAGLQFYLTESTQNFVRWKPIEEQSDELIYELPVGLGMDSVAVRVQCEKISNDKASAAIAYTAAALYQAGEIGYDVAIKIGAAKLDAVYQTHRNRLFNGLPMWPWEMWANGMNIKFDTKDPAPAPRHQWVFMRPSLSPALKFDGSENSELDVGLVVEPVGYVHYTKDDYSRWIGISPMVTITNSNGIGYGALLRYDNWQIGTAYHDNGDNVLLYVSVDLYDLVVSKDNRTTNANEFLNGLTANLSNSR